MSEKKGNTVKLIYDFPTERSCEIEYSPGKWARTTARDFRSFGGNRRILNIDDVNRPFYEEYDGPVYYTMTNRKATRKMRENRIMSFDGIDPRRFGNARASERF